MKQLDQNTKLRRKKNLKPKGTLLITKQVWEGLARTGISLIGLIWSRLKKGKIYDGSVLRVIKAYRDLTLNLFKVSGSRPVTKKKFGIGRKEKKSNTGLKK